MQAAVLQVCTFTPRNSPPFEHFLKGLRQHSTSLHNVESNRSLTIGGPTAMNKKNTKGTKRKGSVKLGARVAKLDSRVKNEMRKTMCVENIENKAVIDMDKALLLVSYKLTNVSLYNVIYIYVYVCEHTV